jgi:hypothetical protein
LLRRGLVLLEVKAMSKPCISYIEIDGYGTIHCTRRPRHAGPHRGTLMAVAHGLETAGIQALVEWHFETRTLRNQPEMKARN